jgi:hypothetical protein
MPIICSCPHRTSLALTSAVLALLCVPDIVQAQLRISAVWPHAGTIEITNMGASGVPLFLTQISTSDITHPNRTGTFTLQDGALDPYQTLVLVDDTNSFHNCLGGLNCKFVDPDALGVTVPPPGGSSPYSIGVSVNGILNAFFQFKWSGGSTTGFTSNAASAATALGMWTNPSDFFVFSSGHAVIGPNTNNPTGPSSFVGSIFPEPTSGALVAVILAAATLFRIRRQG